MRTYFPLRSPELVIRLGEVVVFAPAVSRLWILRFFFGLCSCGALLLATGCERIRHANECAHLTRTVNAALSEVERLTEVREVPSGVPSTEEADVSPPAATPTPSPTSSGSAITSAPSAWPAVLPPPTAPTPNAANGAERQELEPDLPWGAIANVYSKLADDLAGMDLTDPALRAAATEYEAMLRDVVDATRKLEGANSRRRSSLEGRLRGNERRERNAVRGLDAVCSPAK